MPKPNPSDARGRFVAAFQHATRLASEMDSIRNHPYPDPAMFDMRNMVAWAFYRALVDVICLADDLDDSIFRRPYPKDRFSTWARRVKSLARPIATRKTSRPIVTEVEVASFEWLAAQLGTPTGTDAAHVARQ